MGVSLSVSAQQGLQINDIFEGVVVPKQAIKESLIKGDGLEDYGLKVLHSAKFTADNTQREVTELLFTEDMEERVSDDNSNMEMESRNGHLYYAIVQLKDKPKGTHRYICYQCKEQGENFNMTVVYMEGSASLSDLRKTFKKK